MKGRQRFLSQALSDERIGVEEVADGVWSVLFYETELGRFDERDYQFKTQAAASTVSPIVPVQRVTHRPGRFKSQEHWASASLPSS